MFTRRAGAGSAEAQRAESNGARLGRPEQKLGLRLGDSEMWHCHFIAPALSPKHRCPHCAAVNPDMAVFSSIRSA